MEQVQEIQTLSGIREALRRAFEEVAVFCEQAPAAIFLAKSAGKWSVAENLQHLILSGKPVARGLKLPKLVFMAFGTEDGGSRSYEQLVQAYQALLEQGARATGSFIPDPIDKLPSREQQLLEWRRTGDSFQQNLEKWSEEDLDKYRMPHPLLGKLTVREMLFFTIHHTLHHLKACHKIG